MMGKELAGFPNLPALNLWNVIRLKDPQCFENLADVNSIFSKPPVVLSLFIALFDH
ncbi:MAG TPA: hypothetical protein VKA34_10355 [Balneolales bacterium]|nr:hypothetical protein [Balneolales bacterium]